MALHSSRFHTRSSNKKTTRDERWRKCDWQTFVPIFIKSSLDKSLLSDCRSISRWLCEKISRQKLARLLLLDRKTRQSDCTRWRNEIFSFKTYCNSICLQTLPFYSKAEADVQDFVYATRRNVDSLVIFEALQLSFRFEHRFSWWNIHPFTLSSRLRGVRNLLNSLFAIYYVDGNGKKLQIYWNNSILEGQGVCQLVLGGSGVAMLAWNVNHQKLKIWTWILNFTNHNSHFR